MSVRQSGIGMTSLRTRLRMIDRLRKKGVTDETVLTAMAKVPRHIFVDEALASRAYEDTPLPIGFGQTISNPYVVARMSELLRGERDLGRVLEIGTGCGYQCAVLAQFAQEVYSVERIAPLLIKARTHIRELRLSNVRFVHADGSRGLAETAPFDAIIVTAAIAQLPKILLEQLAAGGRLVLPLGLEDQRLYRVERGDNGFVENALEAVRFVPLVPGIMR